MNSLYLFIIVLDVAIQSVAMKEHNKRVDGGFYTFTVASAVAGFLMMLIYSGGMLNFNKETIFYALVFSILFAMAILFQMYAISEGPLSLTSLIIAYSLLIPTFYGVFAYGECLTVWSITGIIFLVISIYMTNFVKSSENSKVEKPSKKWYIYVSLAFFGNGFCSVTQRAHQLSCDGKFGTEFMVIAFGLTVLWIIPFMIKNEMRKKERWQFKQTLSKSFLWYILNALGIVVVNMLVIKLSVRMNASIMFPVISAGGILATLAFSLLLYKEKLSKIQTVGVVFGIIAVIFLNI